MDHRPSEGMFCKKDEPASPTPGVKKQEQLSLFFPQDLQTGFSIEDLSHCLVCLFVDFLAKQKRSFLGSFLAKKVPKTHRLSKFHMCVAS